MSTELIPHLFRTEFGKITSVLTKMLGIENLHVAEDIAGETFLAALEDWPYNGIPKNPAAWLYTVAKNKTRNYLRRKNVFKQKIAFIETPEAEETNNDFSDANISDSMLQMIFAICHPAIAQEAQIGLALRILCGFGIDEIASAFITSKEAISKRLYRAKEKLRIENILLEIPPPATINERLPQVLTTLYLLFSEGYYSENNAQIIRQELCAEAMRLTMVLISNPATNKPEVNALMALMCFHSSRLQARVGENNELILYDDQDDTKWNKELVATGASYFHQSSQGNQLTRYHIEAGIAYWYTVKNDSTEKWENILQLYNRLLQLQYSPVAALNRTYALAKARGNETAINEALKLQLHNNRFYHILLGKLYTTINKDMAHQHYNRALQLAQAVAEKQTIEKQIKALFC
jgi:RNA polymerase sigma-70 factor (ECF subfamily)